MRKKFLWAVFISSLVGMGISLLATSQYLRIQREGFEEKSFCVVNQLINCDIVNASSYATMLGVPMGWWGFLFYFTIAIFSLYTALSQQERKGSAWAIWLLSAVSVLFSLRMAYVLFATLGVVCIECVAMYALNILIFLLLIGALRLGIRGMLSTLIDVFKKQRFLLQPMSVMLAIFAVGGLLFRSSTEAKLRDSHSRVKATLEEKMRAHYMGSLYDIALNPDWPVWGNPKAKVTIVEFSDFECPYCRVAAFNIKPFLQEFRGDVQFRFVNYPLDQACNADIHHQLHKHSCDAARAGLCADKMGKFWAYHDDIFHHQKDLSSETFLGLAEAQGFNKEEFASCLADPQTEERLQRDLAAAKKLFIQGTPTVFVNGRQLRYWSDGEFLRAVIREELKRTKK